MPPLSYAPPMQGVGGVSSSTSSRLIIRARAGRVRCGAWGASGWDAGWDAGPRVRCGAWGAHFSTRCGAHAYPFMLCGDVIARLGKVALGWD